MIDFRHIDKKNGFSSYLIMILRALNSSDKGFLLLVNENNFDFGKYLQHNKNIKFVKAKSKPFSFYQNIEIPFLIKKYRADVFHSINFDVPLFMFLAPKCKLISTIHDLIPIKYKNIHKRSFIKNIYFEIMYRMCALLSSKILTVSNFSRTEIINTLKVPAKRITKIYNSYSLHHSENYSKCLTNSCYNLLFVGTNFEHKNIYTVIKAVVMLKKKNINVRFNIVGGETKYTLFLKREIARYNLEDCVFIFGKVNDTLLTALYEQADCFVFPSLAEGFGIPILEAMYFGLPLITSNKTIMPEIVADAGIMIDPTPENYAEKIEYLIKNPRIAKNLIHRGNARVKNFSEEKFNKKMLRVYQEV